MRRLRRSIPHTGVDEAPWLVSAMSRAWEWRPHCTCSHSMRDLPSDVLGAVRGGFGNASDGLSALGGSSAFTNAIQGELGNFRANSSSGDFLSAIGSRANASLIGDMAKGISPLSGRGW